MATFTDAPQSSNAAANWSQNVLTPEQHDGEGNPEFTSKNRVQFYSDNAKTYDEDMSKYAYRGPFMTALSAHQVLKNNQDAYILDVGCGTGRVLEEMNKLGTYKNADGLEPASGMLQLAKEKGIYQKYMEQFFHLNSGIAHNTYDAVVSCGTFVAGHLKSDCMEEMYNIVKPGGYVVVVMRDEHLYTVDEYKNNLRSTIEKLVNESKWRCIEDRTFPDWCYGTDGKGIDGRIFLYQKL